MGEITKIAFTICSNNYLAQAKTFADSFIIHNPEYTVLIGLVDKYSTDIDYTLFEQYEIVTIESLSIRDFEKLWKRHTIIELNTSIKASFFKYIFEKYKSVQYAFYFDPDMMIFHSIKELEQKFISNDILLTPHILKPITIDSLWPNENLFLIYGIYNLGFIGVKNNSENTFSFLNWWEEHLMQQCYDKTKDGFFVDQLVINFVPLFFKKVEVLNELGYNAAPWNLQERRQLKSCDENYIMEDGSYLTFYHFSSYQYLKPNVISKYFNRNTFENAPDYKSLYDIYLKLLIKNNIETYSKIECHYIKERNKLHSPQTHKKGGRQLIKSLYHFILFKKE